ncbi:MltA domain-containing protein [Acanthopleuribacter pedis]|uniref:peptidoglycan lytic exotransglycosylase n=1 Tax=Acanthopleuribacter pedis TaxID=442870 RepID=A0A8J7QEC3_9BACT|nr:MltA domain-containing protein [Acanthopleuribacter pedis]MBO1319331.1 murein transglycosylase A [Acanthopleuribacter pedis]
MNLRALVPITRTLAALAVLLLLHCGKPPQPKVEPEAPEPPLPPQGHQFVLVDNWPLLRDDADHDAMVRALDRQAAWLARKPADWTCTVGPHRVERDRLRDTLLRFRDIWLAHKEQPEALQNALQAEFDLYQWTYNGTPDILLTGYFAPVLDGRHRADTEYRFPLYQRPKDLLTIRVDQFEPRFLQPGSSLRGTAVMARLEGRNVVPYHDRAAIDGAGKLAGRGLELVYLKDYWHLFSFHVQGGGFVRLENDRYVKLNYAGKNGLPYVSVGKLLIEAGHITRENMSMQALSDYFAANPDEVARWCFQNPSYVFYQSDGRTYPDLQPDLFPHGSLGFPVTTKRSLAFDKKYFGGGMLAFVQGTIERSTADREPFGRFAIDQDTGGAIRENHVDVFMGAGDEALRDAGFLKDKQGHVYFLILKPKISASAE